MRKNQKRPTGEVQSDWADFVKVPIYTNRWAHRDGRIINQFNRIMLGSRDRAGYINVYAKGGGSKTNMAKAHRLVALAFHGVPPNKLQVNHKNGIKDDNRAENLEWATPKENTAHAWATGLMESVKGQTRLQGGGHPLAKLNKEAVAAMRKAHESGASVASIARAFGVSRPHASNIVNKKRGAWGWLK